MATSSRDHLAQLVLAWSQSEPGALDRLTTALDRLAAQDERLARVVECRFFGGMQESEIAEALGISERTVERDWRRARAYLFTVLRGGSGRTPHPPRRASSREGRRPTSPRTAGARHTTPCRRSCGPPYDGCGLRGRRRCHGSARGRCGAGRDRREDRHAACPQASCRRGRLRPHPPQVHRLCRLHPDGHNRLRLPELPALRVLGRDRHEPLSIDLAVNPRLVDLGEPPLGLRAISLDCRPDRLGQQRLRRVS